MRVRGDNAPSNAFSLEEQPNKPGVLSFAECTEMISEYQQATDLTAGVFLRPFHPHCIAAILASYHRRDISGRESVEIFLRHFRQIAAA